MSLFDTGIRPLVDEYLNNKSKEVRDYGDYWSASSAGYCMRKVIFDRLQVPHVKEDARKTRVFEVGNIFHEWMQRITKDAGVSIAQEVELQDEKLMIRGHFDDLVLVNSELILYDYKTQNSMAFTRQKKMGAGMSHFHKMQLGTYMYMLRKVGMKGMSEWDSTVPYNTLTEARTLLISKDDLRMEEHQLTWTPELEKEIYGYWSTLNGYWKAYRERGVLPNCTCDQHENGFMAKEAYNPYWFDGEPCSMKWYELNKESK